VISRLVKQPLDDAMIAITNRYCKAQVRAIDINEYIEVVIPSHSTSPRVNHEMNVSLTKSECKKEM